MAAKLLTVDEVGETLRISKVTVYRLFETGELNRIKIGRRTLVSADDVDRIATEGTSESFGSTRRALG